MILNLGGGDRREPGALTVDLRRDCADVVADVRQLPFAARSVGKIIARDILEHLTDPDAALTEWHRVLQPGGVLLLCVPNLHALAVQISYFADKPGPQLTDLIRNVYGGHRWGPDGAWDTHHWGWTPASLSQTLDTAGFTVNSNDLGLNQTVLAVKE